MVPAQEIEVLLYDKIQKLQVYVSDLWMLNLPQKVRTVVVKTGRKTLALIGLNMVLESMVKKYS